ncbi:hypothetical protein ACRQ4B_06440 [Curtobacterium sp. SP.BCo]|uniref:hypothetical protein n=1 Tax=Curtobacterium sp. SP.BCo TaxID=3435229 RepID=UPI003F738447
MKTQFRSRRTVMAGAALLMAVPLVVGAASTAQAATSDGQAQFEQWYAKYNVPSSTADALWSKFQKGSLLDSMKSGVDPVSERTQRVGTQQETVRTYADGSVDVSSVEVPKVTPAGGATIMAVGACSGTTSSHYDTVYHNCAAEESNGILTMGFHVTYDIVQGVGDKIVDHSTSYQAASGGTATTPSVTIPRSQENSSGPAYAKLTTQYNSKSTSFTAVMYFKVGGDKAYTTKSGWS